jgi:hypothetical protein
MDDPGTPSLALRLVVAFNPRHGLSALEVCDAFDFRIFA